MCKGLVFILFNPNPNPILPQLFGLISQKVYKLLAKFKPPWTQLCIY